MPLLPVALDMYVVIAHSEVLCFWERVCEYVACHPLSCVLSLHIEACCVRLWSCRAEELRLGALLSPLVCVCVRVLRCSVVWMPAAASLCRAAMGMHGIVGG